ncbi:MAG: hypothetical protein R2827_09850 [Bdellovibrionales bacterium]
MKNSGVALDAMSKQLVDIKVISSKKLHDGKMYMSVCGGSTGINNVYEINSSDLEKAKKAGFELWDQ